MNAKTYLKDWIIKYVENRDLILKKIITIEKQENDLIINFKDKQQTFFIEPILNDIDNIINKLQPDKHYALVVLNTIDNFNLIIENWDKLIKFKCLCIYFVNPESNLDKKWMVYPHTHHKICDETSLKTGLKTMFETVEPLTQIENKFK
ncbi:MAG: hypothetical protein ABIF40_04670 [archaeon]